MSIFFKKSDSSNKKIWKIAFLTGTLSAIFICYLQRNQIKRMTRMLGKNLSEARLSIASSGDKKKSYAGFHSKFQENLETLQPVIDSLSDYGDQQAILALRKEETTQWSYNELDRRVTQLAAGLIEAGIQQGDVVALLGSNSPEWLAVCLAILKAGAAVLPIDAQAGDETISHILKDSSVRFIFTTTDQAEQLEQLELETDLNIKLLDGEADDERNWQQLLTDSSADLPTIEPDDQAVLFYTSGTTGPPKGVPLTHKNLAFQINTIAKVEFITEKDRVLLPLPLHHVYPFVFGMLTPLALGLPIIMPQSLTGPQIIRALHEGDVTILVGVPRLYRALYEGIETQATSGGLMANLLFKAGSKMSMRIRRRWGLRLGRLLLRPLHQRFAPHLRTVASAGSKLDPDLAWKLEALGWQVTTGYGLTETAPVLTLNVPGQNRFGSTGQPVEGVEIRIDPSARPDADEEAGEPQAETAGDDNHQEGEILARGPNVFAGYHNLPEKNEETFADGGWFRTGDLGYLDDEDYLHVTGRVSTMLITESGEKVQPDEVEEAYQQSPLIREIGILQQDNQLVAVIVPNLSEIGQKDEEQIKQTVQQAVEKQSQRLPSFQQVSDYVITREALPRTRLGKIRRHLLADLYEQGKEGDGLAGETAGPISIQEMSSDDQALLENSTAREVWDWLAERYPGRRLTPDTNPQLDLGVDSLEWLNLSLEIRERVGVELDEEAIAQIETVRDLLQEVTEATEAGAEPQADPIEEPEAVLSEAQKSWFEPLDPIRSMMARALFGVIGITMRRLFQLRVEGLEHVPEEGPFVLAPNHVSYLDPFAIAAALDYNRLRQTYWGGWTGVIAGNRFIRFFVRLGQAVPIDPERAVISSIAFTAAVLKRNKNLILFPEGQRSTTGELQPFKPGIGLLLENYPVPVIPVFIQGTYEALPPGKFRPQLKPVVVRFGRPLEPDELKQQDQDGEPHDRIVQALQDRLEELSEEDSNASGEPDDDEEPDNETVPEKTESHAHG